MSDALLSVLFFGSFFGPMALERWLHRRRAEDLSRFAFVDVGSRRLERASEHVEASADTYRTGVVRALRLPRREWALRAPNDGRIDVWISRNRAHAITRVDVPWKRRTGNAQPTRAIATLRIDVAPEDGGYSLRAVALPSNLIAWAFLPFFGAIVGGPRHAMGVFVFLLLGAIALTTFSQLLWWLFYGWVVRESAERALLAIAQVIEREATPGTEGRLAVAAG